MAADSRRDLPQDVFINCFGLSSAVNRTQQTGCFVVVDQRLRLLLISCQPRLNGFRVVVSAMDKLCLGMKVADVVVPWWLEIDVVDLATDGTVSTSGHALLKQLVRHIDQNRNDTIALLRGQFSEADGLSRSARETVEDVTVLTIGLRGPFL